MKNLQDEVKKIIKDAPLEKVVIKLKYKNWRGEISDRSVIPISIFYGETEFHKESG